MPFKFEKLEVWELSLAYLDHIYALVALLPAREAFNLASQLRRAATSVALNIAEGSTGQTDQEQARFLGLSIRSLLETVACLHIIRRRQLVADSQAVQAAYTHAERLAAKLHTLRRTIAPTQSWLREDPVPYTVADGLETH